MAYLVVADFDDDYFFSSLLFYWTKNESVSQLSIKQNKCRSELFVELQHEQKGSVEVRRTLFPPICCAVPLFCFSASKISLVLFLLQPKVIDPLIDPSLARAVSFFH